MFTFSKRSMANLKGVHEDLTKIMVEAITTSPIDFGVSCGLRTKDEQRELVREGKSTTMNSRHLTGHAVDIYAYIDGAANWEMPNYKTIADHVKSIARKNDVALEWGGDWESFPDGPHFQLSWGSYVEESEIPDEDQEESIGERPSDTEVPSEDSEK